MVVHTGRMGPILPRCDWHAPRRHSRTVRPSAMPTRYVREGPPASLARGCMNLRQLQYFVAIVDEGGFRQAAARLHVAQPALSRQIQGMEAELGLGLVDRGSRRIALTPA